TAYVELAAHAGRSTGHGRDEEQTLGAPLTIALDATVRLEVVLGPPADDGTLPVGAYAPHDDDTPSHCNATSRLAGDEPPASIDGEVWPAPGATPVDLDGFYDTLAGHGLEYGPSFQGVVAAWVQDQTAYAEVALPDGTATAGYGLHPALLD